MTDRTIEKAALADDLVEFFRQNPPSTDPVTLARSLAEHLCDDDFFRLSKEMVWTLEHNHSQLAAIKIALKLTGLESRPVSSYVRDVIADRNLLAAYVAGVTPDRNTQTEAEVQQTLDRIMAIAYRAIGGLVDVKPEA